MFVSQDAAPFRLKGTHYINTPTGFETIFNAMKSLLNEKNQSRVSFLTYFFSSENSYPGCIIIYSVILVRSVYVFLFDDIVASD